MPPIEELEDYLELLAVAEATAAELDLPIRIEGYPPPSDPKLNVIKVTPDPGVIEVNIHPASSWREAVETPSALYEEARLARLGTDKFMIDGRHTGTGGGNHVVLGGLSAPTARSCGVRTCSRAWCSTGGAAPSLSYLFSGLFIGPTSQAPRIDEGRQDILYELEIALSMVPSPGAGQPRPVARRPPIPQHPDRCIAWFWREPRDGAPVRWGTALHDRFNDFLNVLDDLARTGYRFDSLWFATQREFRFPPYGTVDYGGVQLELRHALEPWHVLGEESTPGGTTRSVDSSVERLQVKVEGLTESRHVVTCNGRRLPLV